MTLSTFLVISFIFTVQFSFSFLFFSNFFTFDLLITSV